MGGPAVAIRKVGVSQLCWKSGHHLKATLRIRNGTNIQLIELRKTGTIQITDNADERFRRGVIAQNKTPGKVASRGANHGQQLNLHFLGITSPPTNWREVQDRLRGHLLFRCFGRFGFDEVHRFLSLARCLEYYTVIVIQGR